MWASGEGSCCGGVAIGGCCGYLVRWDGDIRIRG